MDAQGERPGGGILETFIKDELLKRGYMPPVYTAAHWPAGAVSHQRAFFPITATPSFLPMYHRPAAGTLDLCQYRLSMGEIDDKREHDFQEYMKQAHMLPPEYVAATSQAAKLDMIHEFVKVLLRDLHVSLPDYQKASNHTERADALLKWLMDQEGFLLKPMNCPHHIHIYKAEPHSYRDLPVRLAEFGTVYRYEQTGELNGMTRVRGFTQDDAHLFIMPEQVESEFRANIELVLYIFKTLGLNDYRVRLGFRDPASTKYVGSDEDWNTAQTAASEAIVKSLGMTYSVEPGEAAFYGPKADFVVKDCIGREWQLGTVQLDYNLPKRFDLEYTGADNHPHRPIMIHRAPFGSMERFMGILIEHFAGAFPTWLAPEQVRVLTVSDKFKEYGEKVERQLRDRGFRVHGDYRPDKIGAKIREAQIEKIPYMLVVGDKEQAAGSVAVRARSAGDLGAVPIAEFIDRIDREVRERALTSV